MEVITKHAMGALVAVDVVLGGCTFVHQHEDTQTFAALRPVVDILSCAIAAFHRSNRVYAFACAVAAAIESRALVEV